jgi:hypothetical protein
VIVANPQTRLAGAACAEQYRWHYVQEDHSSRWKPQIHRFTDYGLLTRYKSEAIRDDLETKTQLPP